MYSRIPHCIVPPLSYTLSPIYTDFGAWFFYLKNNFVVKIRSKLGKSALKVYFFCHYTLISTQNSECKQQIHTETETFKNITACTFNAFNCYLCSKWHFRSECTSVCLFETPRWGAAHVGHPSYTRSPHIDRPGHTEILGLNFFIPKTAYMDSPTVYTFSRLRGSIIIYLAIEILLFALSNKIMSLSTFWLKPSSIAW